MDIIPGDGAPESKDLTGEEPPHESDGGGGLVVAWDDDVDELGGRVDVAETDDGDVCVRALSHRLVVGPGVGDDQETGLAESSLDLIGEGTCKTSRELAGWLLEAITSK